MTFFTAKVKMRCTKPPLAKHFELKSVPILTMSHYKQVKGLSIPIPRLYQA